MPKSQYIGKYISKFFDGCGIFVGRIVTYKRPYYQVIYQDGDSEDLATDEVKLLLMNERSRIVDKEIVVAIDRYANGNADADSVECESARERDVIVREFHEAVQKQDISRIATILFDPLRYDMLLSPLNFRDLAIGEEVCDGVSCASLHQDLTSAERLIDMWRSRVTVGDLADIFRPGEGKWYLARIDSICRGDSGHVASMKVHYMNWNKRYDDMLTGVQLQTLRMAPPHTMTPPLRQDKIKKKSLGDFSHVVTGTVADGNNSSHRRKRFRRR